jgi:hypothetical protein
LTAAKATTLSPPKRGLMSAERFRLMMASAPRPDDAFARDVREARAPIGPPRDQPRS